MPSRIDDLLQRAENFAETSNMSLSTISRKIMNDGKGLERLKSGGQCTLKTLDTALERLADLEHGSKSDKKSSPHSTSANAATAQYPASLKRGTDMHQLTHLDLLEAESIEIMREVAAECENPVMLYSVGKDSAVMLHLAVKAFYPSKPPFPIMHVDTTWKFREMIEFRDNMAKDLGLDLIVHVNQEGVEQGISPFTHGSQVHTDIMKTQSLTKNYPLPQILKYDQD